MTSPGETLWAPIDAFVSLWNQHDVAAWEPLFTPDADFVNVIGFQMTGWHEIRDVHAAAHAGQFRNSVLSAEHHDAAVLADGVAIAHVTTAISGDLNPDGTPRSRRSTCLTFVLQGHPEAWRIRAAHNTNVVPPS